MLADKIEELTNRYGALVVGSDNIHALLQDCMNGLRNLVYAYEDLLSWMEEMDKRLSKYKVLSVFQVCLIHHLFTHLNRDEFDSNWRKFQKSGGTMRTHK